MCHAGGVIRLRVSRQSQSQSQPEVPTEAADCSGQGYTEAGVAGEEAAELRADFPASRISCFFILL